MEILIIIGICVALFFAVAFIAFVLRDKTGGSGYDKPPSCSKCRKG